ncbi:hypothetical protein B0T17DRAFT_252959 [Bombardia bombarda]|uniref:2EXR domain-containing protein n=1 Tax=Bombardia bombarda TaxID=252184 RepID=A0AA39X024_9PEZI|nr:hypothetical protein B0T17DRAFT_252959 [Bombardia bombarda]
MALATLDFTLFPLLPAELRVKIWRHAAAWACKGGRVYHLRAELYASKQNPSEPRLEALKTSLLEDSTRETRALLEACVESRTELLRLRTFLPHSLRLDGGLLRCDLDQDVVALDVSENIFNTLQQIPDTMLTTLLMDSCLREVKRLAIVANRLMTFQWSNEPSPRDWVTYNRLGGLLRLIACFPRLQDLFLLPPTMPVNPPLGRVFIDPGVDIVLRWNDKQLLFGSPSLVDWYCVSHKFKADTWSHRLAHADAHHGFFKGKLKEYDASCALCCFMGRDLDLIANQRIAITDSMRRIISGMRVLTHYRNEQHFPVASVKHVELA